MRSCKTFDAQTHHEQTRTHKTHKTHHGPDLGEATIFPLIVFFVFGHKAYTQMSFCPRTPKLGVPKLGLSQLWKPIILCVDLWLKWGLKQSCKPHQGQWYVTCHLHAKKSGRFLTFSGQKSNWHFDSWPFFWP